MPCKHLLKNRCGCPKDSAPLDPVPQIAAALPADLVAERVAQLVVPKEPSPEVTLAVAASDAAAPPPAPKKHHAGPGQPRSPWRQRKEAELERQGRLQERILQAVQAGQALEIAQAIDIALARVCFSKFCQLAWHVIEPSTRLEWGGHHELICTVLQALFEDWLRSKIERDYIPLVRNTVFNCPPGSLKSKLIAVLFPAWVWIRAPGTKFICVSVNDAAAKRDARDNRALMASDWYQTSFQPDWQIREENDAISDFGNTAGGTRLSRASGSVIVGLRGDFFLGDDLNDPEKSNEEAERLKVKQTWDTNQYNRVNDPQRSQRICVQQRVHVDDHTGHVLKKQGLWSKKNPNGWMHIVLPAEFETKRAAFKLPNGLRKYVRDLPGAVLADWRKEEGESLHPERITRQYLEDEKKRWAGTSNYAGQMQQRPAPAGGGKVQKRWFGWFRLEKGVRDDIDELDTGRPRPDGCEANETITVPAAHYRPGCWDFDLVAITVDPAMKKTERGSLWGMIAWGIKGGRRFGLDDRSQRGEPDMAVQVIKELVTLWKPEKIVIENKAGGEGLRRSLEIEMANGDMPMVEIVMVNPGTQDKDARLNSAIPTIANGMLFLREGAEWVYEYVQELTSYPNYSSNDRVDCTTMIINDVDAEDIGYPSASAWNAAAG